MLPWDLEWGQSLIRGFEVPQSAAGDPRVAGNDDLLEGRKAQQRGLEHRSHRGAGSVQHEKRKFRGDLMALFHYTWQEGTARLGVFILSSLTQQDRG